ncbi:MAG: type II toxin-antitoxin system HigB family toxin, partial [Ignavibacterium sp.]|nr:type II toxin-antitoxin system HigB family toxin [Ignavibacterium sp.]
MRIIAIKKLREFWLKHPDAEQPLRAWYKEAEDANWVKPNDITKYYRT